MVAPHGAQTNPFPIASTFFNEKCAEGYTKFTGQIGCAMMCANLSWEDSVMK